MDEEALARELMGTYRSEARERLEAVTRLLLDLERAAIGPAVAACVEQIFREVHSLKGAARSVSQTSVEEAAHILESLLADARGKDAIDEAAIHIWYGHLDHLSSLVESATTNGTPDASPGAAPAESDVVASMPAIPLDASIRVTIPRLDRLLADAGSLLVAEQAQLEALSQLSDLSRDLTVLEASFRRLRLGREAEGHAGALRTIRQQLQNLLKTSRKQRV